MNDPAQQNTPSTAAFRLLPEWKQVLRRAWSIRLMLAAGLLSGFEFVLPYLADDPPLPRGVFNALSVLVIAAAFVARLVAQKGLQDDQA